MKKAVIGYIFNNNKKDLEDKKFSRIAKKLNIELVFFNLEEDLDEKEVEKKAKKCQIIFNDSGESIANELVKTLELLGKKVIENSKVSYYPEDKWVFFLRCKKNKIPTPKTILLSDNLPEIKKELKEFNEWPVILKRVYGCRGEFVDRAKNVDEALKIIKRFWEGKTEDRASIIAQEYINSNSYRVTLIDGKIVQTAIKKRSGWKASGCQSERFRKFKLDKNIKKISRQVAKMSGIKLCGVDFAKANGKWLVIEVNAQPSLKLFDCEHDKMIEKTLKFLKKSSNKKKSY
jgi:RimK family alpha-L-glutamate ligase